VLRFVATIILLAPSAFAREPNSVSLCPPSFRMTERDGCQPNNGSKTGSLPAPVKDDAPEQWNEILGLVANTPSDVRYCLMTGNLRSGWTVAAARGEITRCEQKAQLWREEKQANARINDAREREIWLLRSGSAIAGMLVVALAIGIRAKIAACLYILFVGCLTLQLRFKRSRKRFLDKAIKAAENRLG